MTTTQILGLVGTGLVIVGYVPQIVHLIKEHCTAVFQHSKTRGVDCLGRLPGD
jgi:PQ loop repeat